MVGSDVPRLFHYERTHTPACPAVTVTSERLGSAAIMEKVDILVKQNISDKTTHYTKVTFSLLVNAMESKL